MAPQAGQRPRTRAGAPPPPPDRAETRATKASSERLAPSATAPPTTTRPMPPGQRTRTSARARDGDAGARRLPPVVASADHDRAGQALPVEGRPQLGGVGDGLGRHCGAGAGPEPGVPAGPPGRPRRRLTLGLGGVLHPLAEHLGDRIGRPQAPAAQAAVDSRQPDRPATGGGGRGKGRLPLRRSARVGAAPCGSGSRRARDAPRRATQPPGDARRQPDARAPGTRRRPSPRERERAAPRSLLLPGADARSLPSSSTSARRALDVPAPRHTVGEPGTPGTQGVGGAVGLGSRGQPAQLDGAVHDSLQRPEDASRPTGSTSNSPPAV